MSKYQLHEEINTSLMIPYGIFNDLESAVGFAYCKFMDDIEQLRGTHTWGERDEKFRISLLDDLEGCVGYDLCILSDNLDAPDKMYEKDGWAVISRIFMLELEDTGEN